MSNTKLTATIIKTLKKASRRIFQTKNIESKKAAAFGKIILTPIFYENTRLTKEKSKSSLELLHKNFKLINSLEKLSKI